MPPSPPRKPSIALFALKGKVNAAKIVVPGHAQFDGLALREDISRYALQVNHEQGWAGHLAIGCDGVTRAHLTAANAKPRQSDKTALVSAGEALVNLRVTEPPPGLS